MQILKKQTQSKPDLNIEGKPGVKLKSALVLGWAWSLQYMPLI